MSCNCSTTTATQQSCAPDTSGLERVNYFPRQIMTVDDMVAEADYFREKLRRHNRSIHGWGAVCERKKTANIPASATALGFPGSTNGREIRIQVLCVNYAISRYCAPRRLQHLG